MLNYAEHWIFICFEIKGINIEGYYTNFFVLYPFHGISHSSKCILVTFIKFCYGGCVIGCFSKITIKPGLCTKPEFGMNGSKRYLTGGQYYKIGTFWWRMPSKSWALQLFLVPMANHTFAVTFQMNVKCHFDECGFPCNGHMTVWYNISLQV